MSGAGDTRNETVGLTQIVAALSVTYNDVGVLMWLEGMHRDGMLPVAVMRQGRFDEVAEKVRRIGDADPSDFTVADKLDSDSLPVPVVECPSCGASIQATMR